MKVIRTLRLIGMLVAAILTLGSGPADATEGFTCTFTMERVRHGELWDLTLTWDWSAVEGANYYVVIHDYPFEASDPWPAVNGSMTYPPYTSHVKVWEDISFDDLVKYCRQYRSGYFAIAYTGAGLVLSNRTEPIQLPPVFDYYKGDPISTYDGSLRLEELDSAFPAPGGGIAFSRTYRTRAYRHNYYGPVEKMCEENRGLGKGWHFNWDTRLVIYASHIILVAPDSSEFTFWYDGSTYHTNPQHHDVLETYDDGGTTKYKVTTLSKTIYWFDDEGKIEAIEDSCGRETTFDYNGSGQLIMVTDTAGREYSVDYNGDDNIEHIFIEKTSDDPPEWDAGDLTLATFTYNSTDSDLLETATNAEGDVIEYTYDDNTGNYSYMIQREDHDGKCTYYTFDETDEVYTEVLYSNSSYTGDPEDPVFMKHTFEYGAAEEDGLGYELVTEVTDQNDKTTTYCFTTTRGFEQVEHPDGTVTKLKYDSDDNTIERIVVGSGDYSGYYLKTVNTWGDYSNLLTTVTRRVATEGETIQATDLTFSYDEASFPSYVTEIEDALGHKVYYDYDDTTGALLKVCNKDGSQQEVNKIQYEYYGSGDGVKNGLLKKVIDGCGNETLYDYDSNGNLDEIDREILADITFSYDENTYIGVPTSMTIPGAGGSRQVSYTYDDMNRLLSITYPPAESGADSFSLHYTYRADGQVSSRILKYDDAAYDTTNYTYNVGGFLTHVKNTLSTTDDTVFEYTYDGMGHPTEIEDPLGKKIQYEYDDAYRLSRITYYEDGDGDKYEEFEYYPDGSRDTWTNCAGTTYTYEYNNMNLLQYIKQDTTPLVTFTYLSNRLVDTIENANGTVGRGYDDYNRLTSVDGPLSGTVDKVEYQHYENGLLSQLKYYVDGSPVTVDYTYNDLNHLTEVDYASGTKETTYSYDNTTGILTNRTLPSGVITTATHDDLNRLLDLVNKRSSGEVIDSYSSHWSTEGLCDKVTYADGRYTTFWYDNLFRLAAEVQKRADETVLYDLHHTVDKSGNRTVLQYENNANKQVTFTYNALNQVTGYSGTRGNKINVTGALPSAWTIENVTVEPNSEPAKAVEADIYGPFFVARNVELEDATENSIEASGTGTTRAGNSITSDTESSITFDETPDVDFAYDDDGRRTYKHVDTDDDPGTTDDETDYAYDFLGRLTEIEYDDGSKTKFFYDAHGRKFREEEWDATPSKVSERRYVYNGFTVILELDGNNDPVAEYVYGLGLGGGIGGLLFQKHDGEYSYYNYDPRGNVTSITDEQQNTVALYEYSAYGKLLTKAGTIDNDFLFSTKQYHEKSGLYYFGFRWYDPMTSHWLTRDPLHVLAGFNMYAYAGLNPVACVDPYGLCEEVFEGWGNFGLDCLQTTLDVVGWVDPTPICDGTNAGISLARGNELEAGLNAVAIIPAVGDIIGKGGKGALKASSDVVGSADGFLNNAVEGVAKNFDEGLDGAADASKRRPRTKTDYVQDKTPGQNYEEIVEAQDQAARNRPSIKDAGSEWEGAPSRPKQSKIERIDKAEQNDGVEIEGVEY